MADRKSVPPAPTPEAYPDTATRAVGGTEATATSLAALGWPLDEIDPGGEYLVVVDILHQDLVPDRVRP